jgi:hypothetical protein
MHLNLSLPAIRTDHIPYHTVVIFLTLHYRTINAANLNKDSNHVTKANFSWEIFQTVLSSVSGFRSIYHRARNICKIEWCLRNFIQIYFNGPTNFSKYLIIRKLSSVYIKRYMLLDYFLLVNSWYGLSEFYPKLTWFSVNFLPVSSTFPICCIGIPPKLTLLAVEHRKLRIRHK